MMLLILMIYIDRRFDPVSEIHVDATTDFLMCLKLSILLMSCTYKVH